MYYLYSVAITIQDNTITVGAAYKLSNEIFTGYETSTLLINDKLFIFHGNNSVIGHLCLAQCNITNGTITVEKDEPINSLDYTCRYIEAIQVDAYKILVAHSYLSDKRLTYTTGIFDKQVQLVTSPNDDIYGVAKTNGEEGNMVDVYRPKEAIA